MDDEVRTLPRDDASDDVIERRDRTIQELRELLRQRDEIIQAQTRLLLERQQSAHGRGLARDWRAEELERQLRLLRAEEEATRGRLTALYESSTSWRVTAPLRAVSVAMRSALNRLSGRSDRRHAQALRGENEVGPGVSLEQEKIAIRSRLSSKLDSFLKDSGVLNLPTSDTPQVSIVVILHNQAELTFACLTSIVECLHGSELTAEVVILDNASSDLTGNLLSRTAGGRIIKSQENLHFLRGVNRAAREASGRYLLLLNSDAEILSGSLEAAVRTAASDSTVGAVGGRIILPDGSLQEAGSIIWSDGTCSGYGRGQNPGASEFMYRRDVDYCSAACLLTPRSVFERFGGFDERYAPAYYEEVDYCVRLWQAGLRVVFDPDVVVRHFEFGSASAGPAVQLQERNRSIFVDRHAGWLRGKETRQPHNILKARAASGDAKRVLVIEDRVPHAELGTGYPRTKLMVQELVDAGARVSFYPMGGFAETWPDIRRTLDPSVEVVLDGTVARLRGFLKERRGYYDGIVVCRPHIMQVFLSAIGPGRHPIDDAFVIYDAEALFARRSRLRSGLRGEEISSEEMGRLVAEESRLAAAADAVVSVSESERRIFRECGVGSTFLLRHAVTVDLTMTPFEERSGFVFLGALQHDDSPNADSLRWFADSVLPHLHHQLGTRMTTTVIGRSGAPSIEALNGRVYDLVGMREDLKPWFERARVMIAPTRYAAGIPLKVYQAAALGVPVVCTELVAKLAGWESGRDLLAASDPLAFAVACAHLHEDKTLWERLRAAAAERCREDCSPQRFREGVRQILDAIPSRRNVLR